MLAFAFRYGNRGLRTQGRAGVAQGGSAGGMDRGNLGNGTQQAIREGADARVGDVFS